VNRFFSRLPNLEIILWILASLAAFAAFLIFVPTLLNLRTGRETPVARPLSTPRPTLTPISTPTAIPLAPPPRAATLIPTPIPPSYTQVFTFTADLRRSGWLVGSEKNPHWGDRNLHAGVFKGQVYQSLLYFDLSVLPWGSKILFAEIELMGLGRNNLSPHGTWRLGLVPQSLISDWGTRPNSDFRDAEPQVEIGARLAPEELAEGQVNQFVFTADQLPYLEEALNDTRQVGFRLDGLVNPGDSLFTWDGGDRDPQIGTRPTLRVIAIPAPLFVITNTPTPQNVLTAAAVLVQATESAQRIGTPTLLPRNIATATPFAIVTPLPTPANVETVAARAAFATAVAMTTGTFTPTPVTWITATPQPLLVPVRTLTPLPTATPTLTMVQLSRKPIPFALYGKILFQSGARDAPNSVVMDADGTNLFHLTDREIYDIARARDTFSPAGTIQVFNAPDINNPDTLQVYAVDHTLPRLVLNQLTFHRKGIAWSPSWSPLGLNIAYVISAERDEIYIMDLENKRPVQLTNSTDWYLNRYPSWSPDGKQIVFATDREHVGLFSQIWVMNVDGTGAYKLLDWKQDSWAPVWIKWRQ
jgi:hypothetical protein